ncbi:PBECR4 domain-containing protein [Oenococcus kitaharae]|uniref:Phage-Barnase-EndoU-ColicinE5/D-RelE like nuclease 4 domain-containing protein n=1 Tax=Oenococcus kitaharae DSM 17330 TaxID=1045004 RepID=G9WIN9_9LACO|nr:PBECR4 domain-containing protein [Oenococcus kitaharae]EHN58178.1 hypothetical protein OKIT_0049 [Oenococcus kitaharae DSM 17330]OEY81625.1 hypothetical protein NT95_09075 [Oenococcus kitaharae]OEY83110.1 hypothetical protein NV75_07175 [Oenococcus kitaharae]OEY84344.1 hypothetical protein NT96_03460 [Oenococcus kitaharae]
MVYQHPTVSEYLHSRAYIIEEWRALHGQFKDTFLNKNTVYEYKQGKKLYKVHIDFTKGSFLHLLGLDYQAQKLDKARFWEKIDQNIDLNLDLLTFAHESFGSNKNTLVQLFEYKRSALKCADELFHEGVCISSAAVYPKLKYDLMLRSRKDTLGIALMQNPKGEPDHYILKSTLNLSRQLTNKGSQGNGQHTLYIGQG